MHPAAAKTRVRFDNILYATDFSPTAANAIPFVKKIARHFRSNILAFHVKPPAVNLMMEPATWPVDKEALEAIDSERRMQLLEIFDEFNADVEIDEGDIRSNLEKAIKASNTDLIVIGSHGRSGVAKIFLGSVAEEILRAVSCPVLTVGPHSDPAKSNVSKILFATDFSSEAPVACDYAVSLAQEYQADLTMLHVVQGTKPDEHALWSDIQESVRNRLRNLVPSEASSWCKPEYIVEQGDAADRILEVANARDTDLIVLGARSEEGIPGAATHLQIATVHSVIVKANCPVLTIRSPRR